MPELSKEFREQLDSSEEGKALLKQLEESQGALDNLSKKLKASEDESKKLSGEIEGLKKNAFDPEMLNSILSPEKDEKPDIDEMTLSAFEARRQEAVQKELTKIRDDMKKAISDLSVQVRSYILNSEVESLRDAHGEEFESRKELCAKKAEEFPNKSPRDIYKLVAQDLKLEAMEKEKAEQLKAAEDRRIAAESFSENPDAVISAVQGKELSEEEEMNKAIELSGAESLFSGD